MATKASGEFERALERLEEIVKELDDDAVGLDRSVELFKEAKSLAAKCDQLLKRAQNEIEAAVTAGEAPAPGVRAAAEGLPFDLDDDL